MSPIADNLIKGTKGLPNVTIAQRGEHYSDMMAEGPIVPGACIIPSDAGVQGGGQPNRPGESRKVKQLVTADAADIKPGMIWVAMRVVEPPFQNDTSLLPGAGPNEVVNVPIKAGDYVHTQLSGIFILTLVEPGIAYKPFDILGWDPEADRPAGKRGVTDDETGAWTNVAANFVANSGVLQVHEVRGPYGDDDEYLLFARHQAGGGGMGAG